MDNMLFEQLENAGYLHGDTINEERIRGATWSDIVDLASESAELTSAEQTQRTSSIFSHSASLSLGGGRSPCSEIECRQTRVKALGQFAALYSDRVYIHNFLSDYASHPTDIVNSTALDAKRRTLRNDLEILVQLRPLIEAGRVVPLTAPDNWCPHCLRLRLNASPDFFSEETARGLTSAGRHLRTRFLNETKVRVTREGNRYYIETRGPEELLEHGFSSTGYGGLPPEIRQFPEIVSLLLRGRDAPLSKRQAERSRVHETQAADVLENVLFELSVSQIFGTSFLTERPLHVEILQSLSSDSKQDQRNEIIRKHLTALVPFLAGANADELLTLREQEADSFILFRQALNQAVDEVVKGSTEFTPQDARQLYGDVIEPALARLEVKVNTANRTLVASSRRKLSAWVGAITFGMFSGFVPSSLAAAAKALGFTKIAADLGESLLATSGDDSAIRAEDFYFLWRVKNATKR